MDISRFWTRLRALPVLSVGLGALGLSAALTAHAQINTPPDAATPGGKVSSGVVVAQLDKRKGKTLSLVPSSRWVGVSLSTASGQLRAASLVKAATGATRTQFMPRFNTLLIDSASSPQRANVQTRALQSSGASGVVRVFGANKKGLPIVETNAFAIRFAPSVSPAQAAQILKAAGAVIVAPMGAYAPNGYVARLKNEFGTNGIDISNALNNRADVIYSTPDLLRPAQKYQVTPIPTPNDPLFPFEWHLQNTGENSGGGTPGADVNILPALAAVRGGSNNIIAIIDDSVQRSHPDFAGKIVPGYDFGQGDNAPDPFYTDDNHGTACAGVAAGLGGNSLGVTGAAPFARIMPLRLDFGGGGFSIQAVADALFFAAQNGASVISNSYGVFDIDGEGNSNGFILPANLDDALQFASTQGRGGKGCVILFAAGNDNASSDANELTVDPRVITVSSSSNFDQKVSYSSFGNGVDVCAPSGTFTQIGDPVGIGITTTDRTGAVGYNIKALGDYGANYADLDYTNDFGGTSSSTPLAAGVCSLILSADPNLSKTEVQTILQNTAKKIGDPRAYDANGRNIFFGFGRIDAGAAVQSALVKRATVSGKVFDSTGKGVAGVTVVARVGTQVRGFATTDANGLYTITGLPINQTYVLTPTLGDRAFSPRNRTILLRVNTVGQDFFVSAPATITLEQPVAGTVQAPTLVRDQTPLVAGSSNNNDVQRVEFYYHAPDVAGPSASATQTPVLPQRIPDATRNPAGDVANGILLDDITFPKETSGTLGDFVVTLNIDHTSRNDLTVKLQAPNGSVFTLADRPAGTGGLVGSFTLQAPGVPLAGRWRLQIEDKAPGDVGTLKAYSLVLRPQRIGILPAVTTVDQKGKYASTWDTTKVPDGLYVVGARAFLFSNPNKLVFDEHANILVNNQPVFTFTGRVQDSGNPARGIAGVSIDVSDATGKKVSTVTTDANGAFVTSLFAGTYTFTPRNGVNMIYVFSPSSQSATVAGNGSLPNPFIATLPNQPTPTPQPTAAPTATPVPTPTTPPDLTPPTIVITSPKNNATFPAFTTITGTASDDRSGIKQIGVSLERLVNGSFQELFTRYPIPFVATGNSVTFSYDFSSITGALSDGTYRVAAAALDNTFPGRPNTGNFAKTFAIFTIDNSPPTISITTLQPNQLLTNGFTAGGVAADAGGSVARVTVRIARLSGKNGTPLSYWTGGDSFTAPFNPNIHEKPAALASNGNGVNWALNVTPLPTGFYRLTATATDAGNRSAATSVDFTFQRVLRSAPRRVGK